jgi:hypothetical protein
MKKVLFLFLIAGAVSCSDPYLAPNTNKALTEKDQLVETKKHTLLLNEQNEWMEKQTEYLMRIAAALEQIAKKQNQ